MPATRRPATLQTALLDCTRRRIWTVPELRSHSLLILSPDRLCVTPLEADATEEAIAGAASGVSLDSVLGEHATRVELADVRRVKLDLLANAMTLEYDADGQPRVLTVTFATPDAADACFTKVWRRLGTACELLPYRRSRWSLAHTPLLLLGATLAVTAALALAASVSDDFTRARAAMQTQAGDPAGPAARSPLEALIGWMDWRAVCGVGGAVMAGLQVWLYRRITTPPVSLELARA